jgi:translation initiation factor 2B subunit (eIF-2B alpha/beta/delta family)
VAVDDRVLEVFEAAATDRRSGASEIESVLVAGLLETGGVWRRETIRVGARMLTRGQPVMANLRSLAAQAASDDLESFRHWLRHRAGVLDRLPELLATAAWPVVKTARGVVTVSRSSAVTAVLRGASARGWTGPVVVLDGPGVGGGAEQARLLADFCDSTTEPDAMAPDLLDAPDVVVLVGADAVGRNLFVNASGTRMLLELARAHGRLTALIADTGKDLDDSAVEEIAARSPVDEEEGRQRPVFEIVPLELVDRRFHE